ncbi:MAG: dihydrodipicolinate synthase family protein [Armatimonadota bacterium]|nr:dihydrodipicolinate synthase family protein [Armatimonadota bacterium]MCX7777257.1 dihydrodipicolinate synthase family protein [Armatimonadota bacterium]MDW8024672.1 dihydrodipicolinate synthase family protein [Armatimonadota bacterium]
MGINVQLMNALRDGMAIVACPLALTKERKWDERRQRALCRYYSDACAGGIAVGVHTTQFAIRDPKVGLFRPLLELMAEEMNRLDGKRNTPLFRVAGVCGDTRQAVLEATLASELGYHAGLLSLGALKDADEDFLINHCRIVSEVIPIFGFYLQPAVGGRVLPYSFWRRLADEVEKLVAIKIAPFNRYQTLDVVRAIADSGRDDVALYTGNDDNIILDLLTPFQFRLKGREVELRIVGGLLGQWAVWTRRAVEIFEWCKAIAKSGEPIPKELMCLHVHLTDANGAIFDAAHNFAGCIPGIQEVLLRQGLLESNLCVDPNETLSPGQVEEIDRVWNSYPHLRDDEFVAAHIDEWMR